MRKNTSMAIGQSAIVALIVVGGANQPRAG